MNMNTNTNTRGRRLGSVALTVILLATEVSGFATLPRPSHNTLHLQTPNYSIRMHHHPKRKEQSDDTDFIRQTSHQENKSIESYFANAQTSFAAIALAVLIVFSGDIPNANAGFGPSRAATTSSPPNLLSPVIQDRRDSTPNTLSNINSKKLKQQIGSSLDTNRLKEFSAQLDELTDSLRSLLTTDDDAVEGGELDITAELMTARQSRLQSIEDGQAQLDKAKILQNQILEQGAMLGRLEKQPYWFNYLAAFAGSVASTLVMHPLDTIKTRLQVKKVGDDSEDDDSFMSLYEGLDGNILKEGPPSALYLGVYESVKHSLLPLFGPQYVLLVYLLAGASGEMVGSVIRAPAEAIKTTIQSGMVKSASEAAAQVFGTQESRANIVRAWQASVWRDVPFGAIQLAIFELIKAYILNNADIDFDSSTLLSEALIGAFAGGVGAFLTNPFDIITTRIITQTVEEDKEGNAQPLGVVDMGKQVYEEGGPAAFLVGWQARVGYWAPAISIFLSCYCSVRQAGVQNHWF